MINSDICSDVPAPACPNCGGPTRVFGVERYGNSDDMALRTLECAVCKTVHTDTVRIGQDDAGGVSGSPFLAFAQGQDFDDESLSLLGTAFDAAWKVIRDSGSPLAAEPDRSVTRERLAKYILAAARRREWDANQLVEQALHFLTRSGSNGLTAATANAGPSLANGNAA
jgi:hypothetical protein